MRLRFDAKTLQCAAWAVRDNLQTIEWLKFSVKRSFDTDGVGQFIVFFHQNKVVTLEFVDFVSTQCLMLATHQRGEFYLISRQLMGK